MPWTELKLRTSSEHAEILDELLWDAGAVSVTMTDAEDQPLFEPGPGETPLWQDIIVTGLFLDDCDPAEIEQTLSAGFSAGALPEIHISTLPDQDWVRTWLDDFRPMCFGKRLWVCPSWLGEEASHQAEVSDESALAGFTPSSNDIADWRTKHSEQLGLMKEPGSVVMQLDPGLAFGTGTHPTTSLCLRWLDSNPVANTILIDYGCGSGILGIAALLLGAAKVYGIDNDPQALTATQANCVKNQLSPERFPIFLPGAFVDAVKSGNIKPVEGLMANILAATLIELAELLAMLVASNGWILLSGILKEQSESVVSAYTPWFDNFSVAEEGDWVRISATRKHA